MKYKKLISVLMACAVIGSAAAFSSCGNDKAEETTAATEATTEAETTAEAGASPAADDMKKKGFDLAEYGYSPKVTYIDDREFGFQLEKPEKGEEVAVIHTSMGDITCRLFPEYAPKTVESFKQLAKDGKYDKNIFHRVIDNFMIQGGDYENMNGTGGSSSYGDAFEDEFSDKLLNLRGSLAMANSGADTNGSQFFINQSKTVSFDSAKSSWESLLAQLEQYKDDSASIKNMLAYYGNTAYNALYDVDAVPEEAQKLYEKNGGNPNLDGAYNVVDRGHTVFGQVIDGMDVVDKIAAVKVDENDKPAKDVTIKSIEIKKY